MNKTVLSFAVFCANAILVLNSCAVAVPDWSGTTNVFLTSQKNCACGISSPSKHSKIWIRETGQQQDAQRDEDQDVVYPRSSPKSATTKDGPVKWPMRMNKNRPVPVIEATVNGEGPFLFFFDTGAGTTTLSKSFVEKLKLPIGGKTIISGPGNGPGIDADIVTIESFQIGDVDIRDFEGAAFDRSAHSGGEDMAGSIGLDVFGDLPVTLDYSNNQIIVGGEGLAKADPNSILDCDFSGPVPFFDIELAGKKMSAAFDSGFAGLLLAGEESARKFKFTSEPKTLGKARSVSGEFEIKGATIDGILKVGNLETTDPMLVIMPAVLADREIYVLGHAWGREMAITYDVKNQRVRFQRSPASKAASDSNKSLEQYVGKYGPRNVFQEDGKLMYRREGGPALELKPLGDDTFQLTLPPNARSTTVLPNVRFERNDNKTITGFSLVRDEEVEEYVERD